MKKTNGTGKHVGVWRVKEAGGMKYSEIEGKHCVVSVEKRPAHCDRGNYVAKVSTKDRTACHLDGADGWPRYFFSLATAREEIEAWLRKRGEITLRKASRDELIEKLRAVADAANGVNEPVFSVCHALVAALLAEKEQKLMNIVAYVFTREEYKNIIAESGYDLPDDISVFVRTEDGA